MTLFIRACATETDFSVPKMLAGADDETRICVYLYTCILVLFLKGDSIGWDSWATATLVLPMVYTLEIHFVWFTRRMVYTSEIYFREYN